MVGAITVVVIIADASCRARIGVDLTHYIPAKVVTKFDRTIARNIRHTFKRQTDTVIIIIICNIRN